MTVSSPVQVGQVIKSLLYITAACKLLTADQTEERILVSCRTLVLASDVCGRRGTQRGGWEGQRIMSPAAQSYAGLSSVQRHVQSIYDISCV